jgi:5-formyltetrahydrofolate cyclo-ligase
MTESMLSNEADRKKHLRAMAAVRRRQAFADAGPEAAILLADRFIRALPIDGSLVIGGYWPVDTEIDVRPLLRRLAGADHQVVLPVVSAPGRPLKFREWTPDTMMRLGAYGVHVPPDSATEREPDLVITPLLAYDVDGWRIGYGGGFYDRTLRRLRGLGDVIAVGVGFAAQQVSAVVHDGLDEQLDWIVTEENATKVVR